MPFTSLFDPVRSILEFALKVIEFIIGACYFEIMEGLDWLFGIPEKHSQSY